MDKKSLERRIKAEEFLSAILAEENILLNPTEKQLLLETVLMEIDSGLLAALLADDAVTAIMVNGPNHVYAVQNGHLSRIEVGELREEDWLRILNRMLIRVGEHIDATHPVVEVRLTRSLKLNAVVRPIALSSPTITIRKLSSEFLSADDLVRLGTMTAKCTELLRACVVARLNIVVSGGGAQSGMTTLLNVLANYIPDGRRIITIERNFPKLRLQQE